MKGKLYITMIVENQRKNEKKNTQTQSQTDEQKHVLYIYCNI